MERSLLDVLDYKMGRRTFGIEMNFEWPATELREFKITMKNRFAKTERIYADVITRVEKKISLFYDEIETQLKKEGYWIEAGDDGPIGTCPTLYASEEASMEEYPTLEVYMDPEVFSGVASEKDINIMYNVLKKSEYVSNVSIKYGQPVYDLSLEEYQEILRKEEPVIREWVQQYLAHGYSAWQAGENFHEIYGICLLSEAGDRAFTGRKMSLPYIEGMALQIKRVRQLNQWGKPHPKKSKNQCSVEEANYAFKCSVCGSIITKKRRCDFVNRYEEYSCKCGGEFVKIK